MHTKLSIVRAQCGARIVSREEDGKVDVGEPQNLKGRLAVQVDYMFLETHPNEKLHPVTNAIENGFDRTKLFNDTLKQESEISVLSLKLKHRCEVRPRLMFVIVSVCTSMIQCVS